MKFKKGDIVTLYDDYGRLDYYYPKTICPTPYTGFIIDSDDDLDGYYICCVGGCNHKKWVYSCYIKGHDEYADFLAKIEDRIK